jgi:hypothetical protein
MDRIGQVGDGSALAVAVAEGVDPGQVQDSLVAAAEQQRRGAGHFEPDGPDVEAVPVEYRRHASLIPQEIQVLEIAVRVATRLHRHPVGGAQVGYLVQQPPTLVQLRLGEAVEVVAAGPVDD